MVARLTSIGTESHSENPVIDDIWRMIFGANTGCHAATHSASGSQTDHLLAMLLICTGLNMQLERITKHWERCKLLQTAAGSRVSQPRSH